MMKKMRTKRGFTIIEVSLFLALSGFLMVGLMVGTNFSISRQRYNDSVNSFGEFLRGIYSDVVNVSNDEPLSEEPGRTTTAIYGKYISIGETDENGVFDGTLHVYDVVGYAISSSSASTSRVIDALRADNVDINIFDDSGCTYASACQNKFYRHVTYSIPWDATIEKADGSLFKGGILVVRSPITGGIRTYIYEGSVYNFHSAIEESSASENFSNVLSGISSGSAGGERNLDMCIDSPDNDGANRRNVRLLMRANNSTGVMLMPLDADDNACLGR